jgi:uncharacterized protein (TIGR02118 family)
MPAKLIALYRTPEDAGKFDKHYYEKHVPIAKTVPGLRRFEVNSSPVATPQGAAPYHLVAILHFDSLKAIGEGLASPQGQMTGADLGNFAGAGVELLVMETREI